MSQILLLNQQTKVGVILVAVAGALSTIAVSALLLHMGAVAILQPLKRLTSPQKLPRERVFLTTHLGYYLTCLLISALFGGIASFLEITWAQQGVILLDGRCNIQGVFLQLGDIGIATFSVIIAIHTMNNLVLQKRLPTLAVLFVIFLGWAFTILLAIIGPLTSPRFYDIEGLWCSISISKPGFQIFANFVPLLVSANLLIFIYGATYIKLRKEAEDEDDSISLNGTASLSKTDYRKFLKPVARKLFLYPLVFTVLILPISIVRVAILVGVSVPNYAIIIAAVFDALMGFANTVVYVTTRNVGPSINWGGIRSSADRICNDISDLRFSMVKRERFTVSDRSSTKIGSVYSIGEPKLVQTTNSAEVSAVLGSAKAIPMVINFDKPLPKVRYSQTSEPVVITEQPSTPEPEVENPYVQVTVPSESVARWQINQSAYTAANPRILLPTSPPSIPTRHLRSSRSFSSLRSYNRAPTPLVRRADAPPVDGSLIIESYFEIPDSLRPRVPGIDRSDRPSEWSFHSQASLISHIRSISNSSTVSGASTNPLIPPGMPGGGNLPFSLYPGPDVSSRSEGAGGTPQQIQPETARTPKETSSKKMI